MLKKLLDFFVAGVTARTAVEVVGINRNSVNLFYYKLRTILSISPIQNPLFSMEKSMSLISAECAKANAVAQPQVRYPYSAVQNAKAKFIHQMISDVREKTLMPIIRRKIKPDSIIYTDHFKSYNALDVSEFKHFRINTHRMRHLFGSSKLGGIQIRLANPCCLVASCKRRFS